MSKDAPIKKLLNKDLKDAEHQQLRKFVIAPDGIKFDDVMKPEFWGNVSAELRPWTHITVRAFDGTWYAELLVTSVGRQWARVHQLRLTSLTNADVERSQTGTHDVKFVEGKGWCVIRRADREEVNTGIESREAAETWLADHLTMMANA